MTTQSDSKLFTFPMKEYTAQVTRNEVFSVSESTLEKERTFQKGKEDRKAGKPCASANGAYLNGWYAPDTDFYYITKEAAHLL
jgi:hypothetical protein